MSYFDIYINYVKWKTIDKRNKGYKCKDVLEQIHIDICEPFPKASWNGRAYFVSFIDDNLRYGYLYLIHEKMQSLDMFKLLKAQVEYQLSKKIKVMRFDRGAEYYGRFDSLGEQCLRHFAKYLAEYGKFLSISCLVNHSKMM